jgi:hypothetical protein
MSTDETRSNIKNAESKHRTLNAQRIRIILQSGANSL